MVIAFCDQKQYRDLYNAMVKKAAYDNTAAPLKPSVILLLLTELLKDFLIWAISLSVLFKNVRLGLF